MYNLEEGGCEVAIYRRDVIRLRVEVGEGMPGAREGVVGVESADLCRIGRDGRVSRRGMCSQQKRRTARVVWAVCEVVEFVIVVV